ncbi:hypothetical protein ACQ86G_21510 [Roseateles chitinivorans]|uniref:hypothetical protein n=1 Tax=Roseateles chitinivorans TaxID=2917965 RepID=UPI003D67A27F
MTGLIKRYATRPEVAAAVLGLSSALAAPAGAGMIGFDATLAPVSSTLQKRAALDYWTPSDYPWLAKFDGVTDDTAAIAACATACRAAAVKKGMRLPMGRAVVSASLDLSGLVVDGPGEDKCVLQATAAQFDVVTTTGETDLFGFTIFGGWDGATAGQAGDGIAVKAVAPAFPYNVHIDGIRLLNCKRRGIYIERGGYASITRVRCNASGLHGLELYGPDAANAATTVKVDQSCIFSDTPNGRSVKITNGVNITIDTLISENTGGIELLGLSNRNIAITNSYQENTVGTEWVTLTGSGVGLRMYGNYGVGYRITPSANWDRVVIGGDNTFDIASGAIPAGWKLLRGTSIQIVGGAETTTATLGGVNFTACQCTLPPGIWMIQGTMQTINSAGATLVSAGFRLTNSPAANVVATTGGGFISDEILVGPYSAANAASRPSLTVIYENTTGANETFYMRGFINISAGTIAYKGAMRAVRIG